MIFMILNEKYGISYINYNTGIIYIEYTCDEYLNSIDENFQGLIQGFSKLCNGHRESLEYYSYTISNLPYDISFTMTNSGQILMFIENMRKIDEAVKYIKNSLIEINYNMLYLSEE